MNVSKKKDIGGDWDKRYNEKNKTKTKNKNKN